MANTKISQLTANTNPTGNEEFVYALNNANGKITLDTMKTFANTGQQAALVSGTNIKTINGDSILGSGNLVVSGGGGTSITELNTDANIWELSEGVYSTNYDLYYITGEAIPVYTTTGVNKRQIIQVVKNSAGVGFFAFNVATKNTTYRSRASYGYSISSSAGAVFQLGKWDSAFEVYEPAVGQTIDIEPFDSTSVGLTQVVGSADGTSTLSIAAGKVYAGINCSAYISSVDAGKTYSIVVDGSTVTNPLGILLPSSETRPCYVTLYCTDDSHAIVTGCFMEGGVGVESYKPLIGSGIISSLKGGRVTQIVTDIQSNNTLDVGGTLLPGVTYTVVVQSVASGHTYTVTASTGVTNPLGITLPSSSNKPCVITLIATDSSNAVVTGCTMGN